MRRRFLIPFGFLIVCLGLLFTLKAYSQVGSDTGVSAGTSPSTGSSDAEVSYDGSVKRTKPEELQVETLEGTIMVERPNGDKFPLQSGSIVKKGDTLTSYDKSWIILKDRRGDRIGLDGLTVVSLDEFYDGGPTRQIRLVLQKGNILVKSQHVGSKQSFFEISAGAVVADMEYSKCIFRYDDARLSLKVQYITGTVKIIDKESELKFKENLQNVENTWRDGEMKNEDPSPMDPLEVLNFDRFMNAEPRQEATDENILLKD